MTKGESFSCFLWVGSSNSTAGKQEILSWGCWEVMEELKRGCLLLLTSKSVFHGV